LFGFVLIPITAAAVWVTDYGEKNEDELRRKIKEKYGDQVANVEAQGGAWSVFMNDTIRNAGRNPEDERKFREMLVAGRETKTRLYAVDEELYGTQKGMEERDRLQELYRKEREEKKKKKRKRKKKAQEEQIAEEKPEPLLRFTATQSTAAVVVATAASVAAATALIIGGNGRR